MQTTVVTGHRMAFAVSSTQTVLWDQIQYAGSPKEFAWVLPVRGNAVLEIANDAWFETLDAATSAQISSLPESCPQSSGFTGGGFSDSGGGIGCCGASSSANSDGFSAGADSATATTGGGKSQTPPPPPVTVTHQGTVGPYETVTIHANVPNALPAWLASHSYNLDPSVAPVIDEYTSQGFDFIALRLIPGQGVQQMKPVRVITSGGAATLPLRMVAAGTGPKVAITLFVIGEGRWETQNFPNGSVDANELVWNFATQDSNYSSLRAAVLAQAGGRTWNNAFANVGSLLSQDFVNGMPTGISVGGVPYATFAQAYVAEGMSNGETNTGACSSAFAAFASSNSLVDGACLAARPMTTGSGAGGGGAGGGGTGGSGTGGSSSADAGADAGPSGTGGGAPCVIPAGELDASLLACGGLDDIAVALVGMHPASVWLTRLEANLPHAALDTDLILQASAFQSPVSNVLTAPKSTGSTCGGAVSGALVDRSGLRAAAVRTRVAAVIAMLLALCANFARRAGRAARVVPRRLPAPA